MLSSDEMVVAKSVIESTFKDSCSIVNYVQTIDAISKITKVTEDSPVNDIPCRLSFGTNATTGRDDGASRDNQTVLLFLPAETNVIAGAKITVNHEGKASTFSCTSEPSVYPTHLEVQLERMKKFA